ncbi:MAG: sulfotransferase, partial [Cyanobacteriota bacterium]|nr:sulfotransferase [Cyanobacteriota bacterium]
MAAHAVNLGRCLVLLGRDEQALPHLQRGLTLLDPEQCPCDHNLALCSLAEALQQLGRIDEALALFPATSSDEVIITARAALLAGSGRHDQAAVLLAETLQEHPKADRVRLMAADLADLRGRTGEAIGWLKQGLESDPDNLDLLLQLAGCGTRLLVPAAARQAAERAMALTEALDPPEPLKRAQALVAHGHVLAGDGKAEEAEATFRQALELSSAFVPALSGLGQLLLERGQVDDAIRCYEQVRSHAPLVGWSQLIHARRVPDDPAVLEQMERAARQPSLEGPVSTGLLFTLAAAYDKQKHYAKAIALAAEANAASKPLLPYGPEAHRLRVEREMALFSEAFMAPRRAWGSASRLPVFVLGMPRSGTTLTEQILGSHSLVHGAGELGQIGEQITRMEAWEWKLGSGLSYPDCLWDLTQPECQGYANRLLKALQAFDPAAQRVVDKLPHNFEHIGLIKLLFPNAAVIHVRREPRDIAISNFFTDYGAKFGGMGFAYDWPWIGEQLVDHDRLMAHWHRLFPGQILEVPYEELVADTETWARRMVEHIGLEWEPGVLEFQKLERSVKTASVWQVRQPVYRSSTERWKRYGEALAPLEAVLNGPVPPDPEPLAQPTIPPGLFTAAMAQLQGGRAVEAEAML